MSYFAYWQVVICEICKICKLTSQAAAAYSESGRLPFNRARGATLTAPAPRRHCCQCDATGSLGCSGRLASQCHVGIRGGIAVIVPVTRTPSRRAAGDTAGPGNNDRRLGDAAAAGRGSASGWLRPLPYTTAAGRVPPGDRGPLDSESARTGTLAE